MKLRASIWVCSLVALLLGCQGDGPLIINPLVDRWCGERPCNWEVKGKIERAGTWHKEDYAVSFVSSHSELTQFNATADAQNAGCFDFTMIAKLDSKTRLFLELDFFDDGKIDFSQRIPASDWDRRNFSVTTPTWYEGVRFIVRKDGPGYAALAQLSAINSEGCTATPIDLGPRPEGASCERDQQCESSSCEVDPACDPGSCTEDSFCIEPCAPMTCKGCTTDAGCRTGDVCAPFATRGAIARQCTRAGSLAFGMRCDDDNQCASSSCCGGACSECCDAVACPGDQLCGLPSDWQDSDALLGLEWPKLCAAGEGTRPTGELCANDADCASGTCLNDARKCEDDACFGQPNCKSQCLTPRVIGGTCE